MEIENCIDEYYREAMSRMSNHSEWKRYVDYYKEFDHPKLQEIFAIIHYFCITCYVEMNRRLTSEGKEGYYRAQDSRDLLFAINMAQNIQKDLEKSQYAFEIDSYYENVFKKSKEFLNNANGSIIPPDFNEVVISRGKPLFIHSSTINISSTSHLPQHAKLKPVGSGSYANVFKFRDDFYNKDFAVKRAHKNLNNKEIKRFKQEFKTMKALSSPYVLEVYRYAEEKNEYFMEYVDTTLQSYIDKENANLSMGERLYIIYQILRGFKYIHSKDYLHRDISLNNILLKKYDDALVVKIADFGLVKIPDSCLTDLNSNVKGSLNDPGLHRIGFGNYKMEHETYALVQVVYYVLTGKRNLSDIKNKNLLCFVEKGLTSEVSERYHSVDEIESALKNMNLDE